MSAVPNKLTLIATALVCAAFTPTTSRAAVRQQMGVSSQPREAELVALATPYADPASYLGREVRLHFQLESELAAWNPYLTRFGSDDYRAVRVWSDEQMLWKREEWDAPLAVLFVRRDGAVAKLFDGAPKYARFDVVARERQVFLGMPWIEIESGVRAKAEIGEGALLHASRAMQLIDGQQWQLAIEDLNRAMIGNIPEQARAELLRLRDECSARCNRR